MDVKALPQPSRCSVVLPLLPDSIPEVPKVYIDYPILLKPHSSNHAPRARYLISNRRVYSLILSIFLLSLLKFSHILITASRNGRSWSNVDGLRERNQAT